MKMINIRSVIISVLILLISSASTMAFFFTSTLYGLSSTLVQVGNGPFVSTLHYWTYLNSHGLFYSLLNGGFTIGSHASPLYAWTWLSFYTSAPFFIIINITIPIISFSSIVFVWKFRSHITRDVLFFYFLAITGIILQAGLSGPTGQIYNWLFYHIVFIRAFDTLHLWYSPIIYLSYSVLVGTFVYLLTSFLSGRSSDIGSIKNNEGRKDNKSKINFNKKKISYIISFAILVIVMIPSYPVLDGSAVPHGVPSAEVHIPDYVIETADYLNSKSNISNVITMPLFIDDDEEAYPTGGYRGTNPLTYMLKDPIINQLNGLSQTQYNELIDLNSLIYANNDAVANYYLSQLNIRYILVLGDYNSTYNPILIPFNISNTINMLNNDPNVTLVKEFGPYYIYRYDGGNGLVYASISINSEDLLHIYGHNLITQTMNYSYTNWGNSYSSVTLTSSGLSVYFNYTKGITWPFMQINIININRNIQNYNRLILNFTSSPNTTISVQANTFYGTHLWLTGERTADGLMLNTSYCAINELELFMGPDNTTYNSLNHFTIRSIIPMGPNISIHRYSITDAKVPTNQSLSNIKMMSVQYVNPTSIIVSIHVFSPGTFTLVFSQNYDPRWIIENVSDIAADHIIVDSFMNAWLISFSHAGNYTIHLNFKAGNAMRYFGYISVLSSILVASIYAITLLKKKNKK
ncbi:MAG: hypothetical protein ACP5UV_04060 [Thermoplasmata archaeon]